MSEDESDALTIARWCWPGREWFEGRNGVSDLYITTPRGRVLKDDAISFIVTNANDIRAAELVLIERGLAEEYGVALWIEIDGDAMRAVGTLGRRVALTATAPLDARVRALAAVIRAQASEHAIR